MHLHLNYSVINPTSVERVGNETDTESFKIYIDYYAKKILNRIICVQLRNI